MQNNVIGMTISLDKKYLKKVKEFIDLNGMDYFFKMMSKYPSKIIDIKYE